MSLYATASLTSLDADTSSNNCWNFNQYASGCSKPSLDVHQV